uniref:Uncharacterized protein n=1 Tax=Nelumbo nucifera TaxID=4432 RepID=A0A822Y4T4_NELNU|nr:TPA_asm: hypothetical protein HUJ06_027513 [Nelumbo nucifera]
MTCIRAALRAKTARGVLLMEVTQVEDGFFCSKGWLREQFLMMLFIESTVQHLRDQNDVLNFEWRSTERQSSTLKELVNDCYGTLLDAQLYYTSWSCPTRKLAQQFFQTSRLSVNWISETFLRLII